MENFPSNFLFLFSPFYYNLFETGLCFCLWRCSGSFLGKFVKTETPIFKRGKLGDVASSAIYRNLQAPQFLLYIFLDSLLTGCKQIHLASVSRSVFICLFYFCLFVVTAFNLWSGLTLRKWCTALVLTTLLWSSLSIWMMDDTIKRNNAQIRNTEYRIQRILHECTFLCRFFARGKS